MTGLNRLHMYRQGKFHSIIFAPLAAGVAASG